MPLQSTSGAASYDAFGGGVAAVPKYIEDYFSTFLYSGNAGTQTVTNGIDLSTKGGMVWIKSRSGAFPHSILDTVRGFNYSGTQTKRLDPSTTDSQADAAGNATQASPLTDGFSVTTSGGGAINFYNASGSTYTSWSWAKAPKFFDVVTWTGNGTTQAISHNLGSVPGFIIIKRTDSADDWWCFHRYDFTYRTKLNATNAAVNTNNQSYLGNNTTAVTPTSTTFTVGSIGGINDAAGTYVAYLFAHNAGGFGLTGTDNVISCGSYTGAGASTTVTLGYEPQWLLIKRTDTTGPWHLQDVMRGATVTAIDNGVLYPNTSGAETQKGSHAFPTATGFAFTASEADINASGGTYIYIAIRRGPMKVPTSGTSVFSPVAYTGTPPTFTPNFPPDLAFVARRSDASGFYWGSRLTGNAPYMTSATTAAEASYSLSWKFDATTNTFTQGILGEGGTTVIDMFRRAPSFFDEVCYTGTGGASQTFTHNLGVAPELVIVKCRNDATAWESLGTALSSSQRQLYLNRTQAGVAVASGHLGWNGTDGAYKAPTSSVVYFGGDGDVGGSGLNYVAYLFATCAGVSKVGSYSGTGTTLQIDCGFTGGARFVLIKRTDSTGDWYVWDTARGIVSGNDSYLLLNSTAAEVTNTDYIDTYSAGFEISSTAPAAINASGGTFVFLAIA